MLRQRKIFVLLILSMIIWSNLFAQFRVKSSAQSKWLSDDKFSHLFGGWIAQQQIEDKFNLNWTKAALIIQGLSFVWEIKDGFITHKQVTFWGGNGFDYKDQVAVGCGQILEFLFNHVLYDKTEGKIFVSLYHRPSNSHSKDNVSIIKVAFGF